MGFYVEGDLENVLFICGAFLMVGSTGICEGSSCL